MKRTELLQEIRMVRFEEAYDGWAKRIFTQEEAARLLGVTDRTFRRYLVEYKAYMPAFNAEFTVQPITEGSAFVSWSHIDSLNDILCEQFVCECMDN